MKKLSLVILVLCFSQFTVSSQSCLPEGIIFETQAQIDSFQIIYPNCTEIEGDVRITGDDISNVNGLNVLTSIGGRLQIGYEPIPDYVNPNLTTLTGLANLTSIGGDLIVLGNAVLSSLSGLDNVTSIGGNLLGLAGNQSLISISSLENVTSFEGILNIESNPVLTNLTGLDNLTAVEDLYIGFNDALTDITALNNITSIGDALVFEGNDVLTNLTGLEGLTFIGKYLHLRDNDSLSSLTGLAGLTFVGEWLIIENNNALVCLTGLDSIEASSIDILRIEDNSSLSICEVQSVCDYLADPGGTIEINNNATGCNSQQEVEEACESVSVEEMFLADYVTIYPNPANQVVHVSLEGLEFEEVSVYTLTGQQVIQTRPVNGTIDISPLQPGMYIVEVMVGGRKVRRKLLVE